ncbi:MAG: CoA transferase subunit A, partial [Candidatus Thermoplasmatota archaeon]|nr:CoA transferase subunit A [Candidatus Thermoplasmatota archaeon]
GSLHCIRRGIEKNYPNPLEIEEYTHGSLISALFAGGAGIPFFPADAVSHSDLPQRNKNFNITRDPFTNREVMVVRPLHIDVSIIHVQRADEEGNAQMWGITGEQREVAFTSKRVIVSAEEIVDSEVIKGDPNRTIIPGFIVSSVVRDPWGAHPSYAQGFYDRDNDFYLRWDKISRIIPDTEKYLEDWVYGLNDREEYMKKLGTERQSSLRMKEKFVTPLNYGSVT